MRTEEGFKTLVQPAVADPIFTKDVVNFDTQFPFPSGELVITEAFKEVKRLFGLVDGKKRGGGRARTKWDMYLESLGTTEAAIVSGWASKLVEFKVLQRISEDEMQDMSGTCVILLEPVGSTWLQEMQKACDRPVEPLVKLLPGRGRKVIKATVVPPWLSWPPQELTGPVLETDFVSEYASPQLGTIAQPLSVLQITTFVLCVVVKTYVLNLLRHSSSGVSPAGSTARLSDPLLLSLPPPSSLRTGHPLTKIVSSRRRSGH
jgi:hypothetical protein